MRNIHVMFLLLSVWLMACLGSAPDREITGNDLEVARKGLNDAVKDARLISLDVGELAAGLAVGRTLELELPGAGQVELVTRTARQMAPGIMTFSGHLAGDDTADFTLSIEAGKLVGSVRQGTYAWLVEPHSGSDRHVIRMIDRTLMPKDEPPLQHSQKHQLSHVSSERLASTTLSTGEVRVLFLHASNVTNASARATNIVDEFNASLVASDVAPNNKLTWAGVQQVASDFDNQSRYAIISAMVSRSGPFAGIDAALASAAADIAFLLVSEDTGAVDVPGFGRVGGAAVNFDPSNPFALSTTTYALGDLTALHELGHVFGGNHENFPTGIARPVVAPDRTWMTLMGGYIDCPFTGLPATCVRLNRWSNPDQTYQGIPLGVPGQRDMESHLESSMPVVSGWRGDATPAEMISPVPGSTFPGSTVTFTWSPGIGVSQYYLYIGSSPGGYDLYFGSQGTATSRTVTGLPTDGRTIYVKLWSLIGTQWHHRDYTYTAALPPPRPAEMISPVPGSTFPGSTVTFTWNPGIGVSQYYLYVGSSFGAADLYAASQGTATSRTVTGLPTDGRTIYVRLWSLIGGGWQFRSYTYTAASSCHPLAGTHGQIWMPVSAESEYVYNWGWCTVGRGLPEMCFEGTYFYYQTLQSSYCSSVGSSGSCYDDDAWWQVTCNSLVDCIYNCSGQCVKADC